MRSDTNRPVELEQRVVLTATRRLRQLVGVGRGPARHPRRGALEAAIRAVAARCGSPRASAPRRTRPASRRAGGPLPRAPCPRRAPAPCARARAAPRRSAPGTRKPTCSPSRRLETFTPTMRPAAVGDRAAAHAGVDRAGKVDVLVVALVDQAVVGALDDGEAQVERIAHRVDALALGQLRPRARAGRIRTSGRPVARSSFTTARSCVTSIASRLSGPVRAVGREVLEAVGLRVEGELRDDVVVRDREPVGAHDETRAQGRLAPRRLQERAHLQDARLGELVDALGGGRERGGGARVASPTRTGWRDGGGRREQPGESSGNRDHCGSGGAGALILPGLARGCCRLHAARG